MFILFVEIVIAFRGVTFHILSFFLQIFELCVLYFRGTHEYIFKTPNTDAQKWDLWERGPRMFMFQYGFPTLLQHLAETLLLFEPCLTKNVGDYFANLNLKFLRENVGIIMEPRSKDVPEIMPLDKNLIENGDTFDILRLDGLGNIIK